jgi:nucleotide-binding universal stress UspA family protein
MGNTMQADTMHDDEAHAATHATAAGHARSGEAPRPVFADILCAVDGTRSSMAAVRQAATLAGSAGRLTLLAVTAVTKGAGLHETAAISPARVKHVLDHATAIADAAGVASTRVIDPAGPPLSVILEHARRHELLALGAPAGSWLGSMLVGGGVAAGALQVFDTPLLLARRSFSESLHGRRILVASDGATDSDRLVELAGRLGFGHGASVTLVHALGPESKMHPHHIESQTHALERAVPGAAATLVEPGRAHEVIIGAAKLTEAALIVMGSRRLRDGIRALGSVSTRVVHDGPCSVLLLPPEEQ